MTASTVPRRGTRVQSSNLTLELGSWIQHQGQGVPGSAQSCGEGLGRARPCHLGYVRQQVHTLHWPSQAASACKCVCAPSCTLSLPRGTWDGHVSIEGRMEATWMTSWWGGCLCLPSWSLRLLLGTGECVRPSPLLTPQAVSALLSLRRCWGQSSGSAGQPHLHLPTHEWDARGELRTSPSPLSQSLYHLLQSW